MADLDHNLSLADALTEPPPEIEEEVKRDFIATLEAEKFDDVVGETVDKTDYVPLLDDDDAKPGSQEPKSKSHADGVQVEHTSASGPTVVENGDHGIEDHRTVFPGEIMDEKLSYKEFLDRNDSWTMDDRDLCFESQPVFKPMEMADPFSMHRGDNLPDLSFPADMKNVPLFMDRADASRDIHAPHGPMMVPEQPFLGPLYSPAEALDPSAFIGLDSTAEFLQDRAVPEERWMGAQHDVKGPDASFFVEPPVPPTATEATKANFPESPVAAAPGFVPAAVTASPGAAEAADGPKASASDAACVPTLDVAPVSAEKAGSVLVGDAKPAQALDAPLAPAAETNPFQAVDVGFAPPPEAKAPPPEAKAPHAVNAASTPTADTGFPTAADATSLYAADFQFPPAADAGSHFAMDLAFAPAADTKSPHAVDSEFAPAADTKPHHDLDSEFGPAAGTKSHHAVDSEFSPAADAQFAPAGEVNHHHAMDSAVSPVAEAKPLPAVDSASAGAQPVSAAGTEVPATQELKTPEPAAEQEKSPLSKVPAEATASVEHEPKVPEVCVNVSEKAKDGKTPPSPHDEHLPEQTNHLSEPAAPVEAKEAVAVENKDLLPEKSVTAGAVTATEKEKEEAEHNHVQHGEPQQEEAPPEPTGLPTAQIRQANKSSERRFGRAKPAPVPVTDVPEERPVGLPQPKSTDPKAEPCPVAELGRAAGTSPRSRVSHQKATERPSGAESCGDLPGESWDLEGSAAVVKKKKKKPKQKRNQPPRATEFWDENVAASKAPRNSPLAAELRKPDDCPLMPAEARGEQPVASAGRAADTPKDARRGAGSHVLDEQNAPLVPAQQAQKPSVPSESMLAAKNGDVVRAEGKRDDGLMLQSKGKRKEVPLEQVGKTKVGESVPAKGPTKPTERDFPDKNEKREYKESKCADLAASLSEAIDVSKAETPLQPRPPELLPSDQGKEAQCSSPRRSALSDAVRRELQAARGSLEAAAKQRGCGEKSKEVEKGSFGQPRVEDKLPHEPKAAAETKPASSEKCLAVAFSTSEGALKTPTDTAKMPAALLVSPKPEEVGARQNRKAGVSSEQPCHLSAKSAASERPPAAGAGEGTVVADSPEKNKGKGFVAFEQQPGKDLGIAHGVDRPKKKRGEGRAKKIKSFSEQMMPWEDVGKLGDGVRTDETGKETTHPEPGRGSAARGHPSGSATHASPADKPKKRGSDGRSKKGDRSFFQQPFLESKMDPSSFPDVTGGSQAVGDRGRERGCVTAERFQENTSDVTKMQRPVELVTGEPKENLGKSEIGDLGALGESRREEAKHLAVADTVSKTEEVNLIKKGGEAGVTPAAEPVAVNPDAALVAGKPRKRCSDGRTKTAEKSLPGQAAALDAGVESSDFPGKERVAGSTREMPFGKEQVSGLETELLLENPTRPAREVLGKPEIQDGTRRSVSDQPVLSGHKTETSEPEVVSAKETGPVSKGEELETPEPLPEHRLEAALAQSPTRGLVVDKPRKKSRDVKGKKAENGLEPGPGHSPAVGEEVGGSKGAQAFDKGKETNGSSSASPPGDPADTPTAQAPVGSEKSQTSSKENCKKPEADVQQPVLFEPKAGAGPSPDVEIPDKSEAESPAGGGLPFLEHPAAAGHALATVPEKSKKRGYDGSGKKAKNASEQPVLLEPKPNRSEGQPPTGSELGHGVGDTDLVDENRNIKNFPIGPQMLWNSKGSDFRSFGQTAAAGPGTGSASSGFPKHAGEGASSEGLPPPEAAAERSSREPGAAAAKETRVQKSEQPMAPGHQEPAKEVSKEGGKTQRVCSQDGSGAGKPLSLDHAPQQDVKSRDEVHLSPAAKVDDKEISTMDKKRDADSDSLDLPQKAADSKSELAPVGSKGTEKLEAAVSSGEKDAGRTSAERAAVAESEAGAAVSRVAAEALVEKKAEEAELGGGTKSEQSSLGGLADTAAEAEAPGFNVTAAQTATVRPPASDEGDAQPAEGDAARRGDAHPRGTPALRSEGGKPQDTAKEKEAECDQKAAKEVKKVKAAEQIIGYMRPTKARGVPALPARSAAPDREKPRQLKPAGVSRQRPEKGVCVCGVS